MAEEILDSLFTIPAKKSLISKFLLELHFEIS